MTPHDTNCRIKLTWGQIVWGVSMFLMLAGMWGRLEVRMALIEAKLEDKASTDEVQAIARDLKGHTHGTFVAPDAVGKLPRWQ